MTTTGGTKPTIGRIVHYRSKQGPQIYPAMIIRTHETTDYDHMRSGLATMGATMPEGFSVELEGGNVDLSVELLLNTGREFNVPYDADGAPGTWSWPPRA